MPVTEEITALRQQILNLLQQQMEALNSALGLTDDCLAECYQRQDRVQELREKLQALSGSSSVIALPQERPSTDQTSPCATEPPVAVESAVGI